MCPSTAAYVVLPNDEFRFYCSDLLPSRLYARRYYAPHRGHGSFRRGLEQFAKAKQVCHLHSHGHHRRLWQPRHFLWSVSPRANPGKVWLVVGLSRCGHSFNRSNLDPVSLRSRKGNQGNSPNHKREEAS